MYSLVICGRLGKLLSNDVGISYYRSTGSVNAYTVGQMYETNP